jgi:hypothetical protein
MLAKQDICDEESEQVYPPLKPHYPFYTSVALQYVLPDAILLVAIRAGLSRQIYDA